MSDDKPMIDRRRLLVAALAGSGATFAACSRGDDVETPDHWAGYDERITERTLAEAEKLFGLEFSESERHQILGGPIEEADDGFFARQVASLRKRRAEILPSTLAPALSFDPRLPGIDYGTQVDSIVLYPRRSTRSRTTMRISRSRP